MSDTRPPDVQGSNDTGDESEGVSPGRREFLKIINDGNEYVATRVSPGNEADMQNPNPDPGEEYQHVNTALFNRVDPLSNQFIDASDMLPPYNHAPDLADAINLAEPRDPSTWPTPTPRPAPVPPVLGHRPLNDVEKSIVGLAIARFSPQPAATAIPATLGAAQDLLRGLVGDSFKHP